MNEFLRGRRKAELQTIHQFWFPGEPRLTKREELESRVAEALIDGLHLGERLARLSQAQRDFLGSILEHEDFQGEVYSLLAGLEAAGRTGLEVESAARTLTERGFIARLRSRAREVFEIPQELAEQLKGAFSLSGRNLASADQLSQKRLPFDIDFEGTSLREKISRLEDPTLQALVKLAVENHGLVDRSTPGVQELLFTENGGDDPPSREGAALKLNRAEWRRAIEEAGIGTVGQVSLKDFGILVEEPALIIFQEWIKKRSLADLEVVEEPDTLLEAGVDLYCDLDAIARQLEEHPARLTRGGRIPKRLVESLRGVLYLPRLDGHLEGDLVESTLLLASRTGILENYGDELRVYPERLQMWRKLDLVRQVETILERFLEESQGGRWSFHQEALRNILIATLQELRPDDWISFEALIGCVVSTYLLELDEREVKDALRQRREEDFARERLNTSFHRLGADLVYWIVNRLLLLGVCELGLQDGRISTFRLSPLGKEVLRIQRRPRPSRILVNPDFEIILFSEGLRGMRLELQLSRFGERVSAERIRRYRVTRESMRQGIRSGLSLAEIRKLLQSASEHPLPETVLVALKDWGQDLDWIQVEPAIVLTGLKGARARELSEFLSREGCRHQLCDDGSIVIRGETGTDDRKIPILETLREEGWLVREPARDRVQLSLEHPVGRRA